MNVRRTSVRLLAGSAAGSLALAAVMALPAGSASAAPAAPSASAASAASAAPSLAAPRPGRTTRVDSQLELRRAVALANQRDGVDQINLTKSVGMSKGNGKGNGALTRDIDVTDNLIINGANKTINGRDQDRIFDVPTGVRLELNRVTLRNASPFNAAESGGALRVTGGQARLGMVTISGSEATGSDLSSGGAIMNDAGRVVLVNSTVSGNTARRAGGGIEANAGTTVVTDSDITGNTAGPTPGNGGGLHVTGAGTVTVTNTRVADNTAASEGGGLWNSGTGRMTVRDSTVSGNRAAGVEATNGGGGLFQDARAVGAAAGTGTLTVTNTTVTGNLATGTAGSGGGILNDQGVVNVTDSTLGGNSSVRAGGGIETNIGTVSLTRVALTNNRTGATPGNGGGFHTTGAGTVTYAGGTVTRNTATNQGGGLWNSATGTMTVSEVAVTGNTAPISPNAYQDGAAQGAFTINNAGTPVVVPNGNNPAEYPNP